MFTEPVVGKDFFGRKEQLEILKERAKAFKSGFRQNIAILGCHFIGKTSLIVNFLPYLLTEQIIHVYVEAQEEPFDFFTHRFIGSLLYQYLKSKGAKLKKYELGVLIKHCKKSLPKTVESIAKIAELIKKKDFSGAYEILLDLPRLMESDSGQKCAVIIEEFDKLAHYKLNQPFSVLGRKIMTQRNVFYIVTSSSVNQAKQILTEKLQLLFGKFEIIELKEFDFPTSRGFLLMRLAPHKIKERNLKFLISFTNGHPLYIDAIAGSLKDSLSRYKCNQVSTMLMERSLNEILFYPKGQLYRHFTNIIYRQCSNKNGVDILSVLVSLSNGKHKLQCLADSLDNSTKSLSRVISDLEKADLVKKYGVFMRIADFPLRFWLHSVYHKRRIDFTGNLSYQEKSFTTHIKKIANDFVAASKQDLYEKTVDLFKSFNNEIVQIGQKRFRLPIFSDVATRIIGENGPYVIGHSNGKNWICQIHERHVSEKHIQDFLKDTKIGKYKFQRILLVVLNGMDDNAKLLSKESGIWVWNLKALNLLLDLYGKQKVVIY